jgi:hypothetical protein
LNEQGGKYRTPTGDEEGTFNFIAHSSRRSPYRVERGAAAVKAQVFCQLINSLLLIVQLPEMELGLNFCFYD